MSDSQSEEGNPTTGLDPAARRLLAGDEAEILRVRERVERIVATRGYYIPFGERPDVVQATILTLWRALGRSGVACRNLDAYAATITHRACVNWMRTHRATEDLPEGLPDDAAGSEAAVLEAERVRLAKQVIGRLGPGCRELLRLRVSEGLGPAEIARRLSRSEGSVRTQTWKCLRRARDLLRGLGVELGTPVDSEREGRQR